MCYEDFQKAWVKAYRVRLGDIVRLIRQFDDCESGFVGTGCYGNGLKGIDMVLNQTYIIAVNDDTSVIVQNTASARHWTSPAFALEPVKP
jgi:hypothetical protein